MTCTCTPRIRPELTSEREYFPLSERKYFHCQRENILCLSASENVSLIRRYISHPAHTAVIKIRARIFPIVREKISSASENISSVRRYISLCQRENILCLSTSENISLLRRYISHPAHTARINIREIIFPLSERKSPLPQRIFL